MLKTLNSYFLDWEDTLSRGRELQKVEEAEIVINSFYTGLGLFLQISIAHWFYPRYFLISLLPDTTLRLLIDISEFQIHEKGLLLPIIDYPFSCLLIRHLDGPISLCFRQCLSCCWMAIQNFHQLYYHCMGTSFVQHLENTPEIKFDCQ